MLLPCPKVHAVFLRENLEMGHEPPAWVRWDEHGGTFILRVVGLKLTDASPAASGEVLFLEVALTEAPALQEKIQGFAARHHLPLHPPRGRRGNSWSSPSWLPAMFRKSSCLSIAKGQNFQPGPVPQETWNLESPASFAPGGLFARKAI